MHPNHTQASLRFPRWQTLCNPSTAAASRGGFTQPRLPAQVPTRSQAAMPAALQQPPALTTSPSPRTSLPHALPGVLAPEPSPSTPSDKLRRCPKPPGAVPALRGSRRQPLHAGACVSGAHSWHSRLAELSATRHPPDQGRACHGRLRRGAQRSSSSGSSAGQEAAAPPLRV